MSECTVATENLTRRFGSVTAVEALDLQVPQGSVYGFLGPNGAGKTTTIRMLLGLIRPHRGVVHLFGRPLHRDRIAALRRVGALVESPSLYPHLTGRENLELTRRLIAAPRAQIDRVLHLVQLDDAADRLVKGYSTGMRQRLGLALALLGEPDLLILDEPTNGLDPAGIREMRGFIRALPRELGATVLMSSHLLNEVEQVATHIGIIHQGRLLFQGPQQALQAQLSERLALGVDRPQQALACLAGCGWTARADGDDRLYVEVNGRSDAALINQQLAQAGLNVFHLALERASLEEIFMTLTGEEGAP